MTDSDINIVSVFILLETATDKENFTLFMDIIIQLLSNNLYKKDEIIYYKKAMSYTSQQEQEN